MCRDWKWLKSAIEDEINWRKKWNLPLRALSEQENLSVNHIKMCIVNNFVTYFTRNMKYFCSKAEKRENFVANVHFSVYIHVAYHFLFLITKECHVWKIFSFFLHFPLLSNKKQKNSNEKVVMSLWCLKRELLRREKNAKSPNVLFDLVWLIRQIFFITRMFPLSKALKFFMLEKSFLLYMI